MWRNIWSQGFLSFRALLLRVGIRRADDRPVGREQPGQPPLRQPRDVGNGRHGGVIVVGCLARPPGVAGWPHRGGVKSRWSGQLCTDCGRARADGAAGDAACGDGQEEIAYAIGPWGGRFAGPQPNQRVRRGDRLYRAPHQHAPPGVAILVKLVDQEGDPAWTDQLRQQPRRVRCGTR